MGDGTRNPWVVVAADDYWRRFGVVHWIVALMNEALSGNGGRFGVFEAFDFWLKLKVLVDPLLFLSDEFLDLLLERVEGSFFFSFLLLALVELIDDLQVLLAVRPLLEFFKTIVEGQLLLLPFFLVQQVLELVKVRALFVLLLLNLILLLLLVPDAESVVGLRGDQVGFLGVEGDSLGDLQVFGLVHRP
jgi:hypothetical protein